MRACAPRCPSLGQLFTDLGKSFFQSWLHRMRNDLPRIVRQLLCARTSCELRTKPESYPSTNNLRFCSQRQFRFSQATFKYFRDGHHALSSCRESGLRDCHLVRSSFRDSLQVLSSSPESGLRKVRNMSAHQTRRLSSFQWQSCPAACVQDSLSDFVKLSPAETLQHEVSIVRAILHVFQFTSVRTNFLQTSTQAVQTHIRHSDRKCEGGSGVVSLLLLYFIFHVVECLSLIGSCRGIVLLKAGSVGYQFDQF